MTSCWDERSTKALQRRARQLHRLLQPRGVVHLAADADAQHGVAFEDVERCADGKRAPEGVVAEALDLTSAALFFLFFPPALLDALPERAAVAGDAEVDRVGEGRQAVEA